VATRVKSRAVEAAEMISERSGAAARPAPTPAPDGRWTKPMVGRAVLAFGDIDRIPQYDDDAVRAVVRDFLRFVHRVEAGGVEEDAMPLARTFIARGYQWLADHPQYAPIATRMWNLDMVENLILWFNDATTGALDRHRLLDVAERLHTFERVLKSGAVEAGEAELLAEAFLDFSHRWLHAQPDALAHYQGL
jgi:hypothetical protein